MNGIRGAFTPKTSTTPLFGNASPFAFPYLVAEYQLVTTDQLVGQAANGFGG